MQVISALVVGFMLLAEVSSLCLTQLFAQQVASNYALLFTNYSNNTANRVLSPDFIDQSDSVESLANNGTTCPYTLGSLFSPNRAAFEAASSTQPYIPLKILQTYYDCTHVFVKWVITYKPQQIQGIAILTTEFNLNIPANIQTPFLITEVQAEFNSIAWAVDLGNFHGTPPPGCRR